nr:hypothetical protein 6 [Balneolaceae bacterium]
MGGKSAVKTQKGKGENSVVDPEYVPYGPEWEEQMMKHSKSELIDMYRKVCIENNDRNTNEAVLLSQAGYYDMIEFLVNISNAYEEYGEIFPHQIEEVNNVIEKYVGD